LEPVGLAAFGRMIVLRVAEKKVIIETGDARHTALMREDAQAELANAKDAGFVLIKTKADGLIRNIRAKQVHKGF
jgi:hypothetical protein